MSNLFGWYKDTQHLFRRCPLAIETWDRHWIGMPMSTTTDFTFWEWLTYWTLFFHNEDSTNSRLPKFVGGLWSIWNLRNEQVFCNCRPTSFTIDCWPTSSKWQSTWHLCCSTVRPNSELARSHYTARIPLCPSWPKNSSRQATNCVGGWIMG